MRGDDPDRYGWVARESSYESAGCLTLVSGLDLERALIAVGADPLRQAHESGAFAPEGLAALAAVSVPWKEPAVVLIEENGYEGSRDEVLRALSKKGIAASAYWNVNGVVRFGCARRGKVLYTSELPDDEADEAPRVLRSLATAAEADDANLVAIAVAMAATYTGIEVPRIDEVSRPALFHPITNPVLGLRVTAEELVGLGYPTPDLVSAAQSATSQECRRLVRWAVLDAVQGAGLRNHPAVAEIVDQLDGAGPAALGSAFIDLRNDATRALDIASDAVQDAYNSFATDEEKTELVAQANACGRRYWAVQAMVYSAVNDPVTAALGATYCATIQYGLDSENAAGFHQRALQALH